MNTEKEPHSDDEHVYNENKNKNQEIGSCTIRMNRTAKQKGEVSTRIRRRAVIITLLNTGRSVCILYACMHAAKSKTGARTDSIK